MNRFNVSIEMYRRLWPHISHHRRVQLIGLIALVLLSAISEVVSLGAVIPFLSAITNFDSIKNNYFVKEFSLYSGIVDESGIVLAFTILFISIIIISSLIRILFIWSNTRFSYSLGAELASEMYIKTLAQPYAFHTSVNSSEVISGITTKASSIISGILYPTINIFASIILAISMIGMVFYVDPGIAMISLVGLGIIYIGISKLSKEIIRKDGITIARLSSTIFKILKEGLGGIREIKIDGSEEIHSKLFKTTFRKYQVALADVQIISLAPRYLVEMVGMVFIATIAYQSIQREPDTTFLVAKLGALALCAQKILPIIQQLYSNLTSIIASRNSVEDALNLLDQHISKVSKDQFPTRFNKLIKLENVLFKYSDNSVTVLENVNIEFKKGDIVGIIGKTGSGKSTLVDILMGLLTPVSGSISIDDTILNQKNIRVLQNNIAHVPQKVFFKDASIAENIAFNLDKNSIDLLKIKECINQVQLMEMIDNLPEKLNEKIGEDGVKLSGGQLQRIGIARALYKSPNILIMDESTSALDIETEKKVLESIQLFKNITVIIISHRLETLSFCNKIYMVENKKVSLIRDVFN
jgi:ABC-type bacteriocin/lantibiotic exporter with double-glycine peptidase domain